MQCQKCGREVEAGAPMDAAAERALFCPACRDPRMRAVWWVAIAIGVIMLATMIAVPLSQM